MTDGKLEILSSICKRLPEAVELPPLDRDWINYENAQRQFIEMLTAVGGHCILVDDNAEIVVELDSISAYTNAKKVCSLIDHVGRSGIDLDQIENPHELEDVDFAILPGQFAVAENGAVWVTDEGVKHRALYFITQHLALVVSASEVVHNMHEAYARLPNWERGFGTFISGPSKTADIEQSLVIGAHGPRSLTVFLLRQ